MVVVSSKGQEEVPDTLLPFCVPEWYTRFVLQCSPGIADVERLKPTNNNHIISHRAADILVRQRLVPRLSLSRPLTSL